MKSFLNTMGGIKNYLIENLGHEFIVSLFSGILSGLIVSMVIGLIVYQYTSVFKSPKLSFVVKQNGFYRDTILLSDTGDGKYEASFQFAIKNSGNQSVKAGDGYWHLYIETATSTPFSAPGENDHNRDMIQAPIYAGSFFDINFNYKLSIQKENIIKARIPYFFQTAYGNYPESAKLDFSTGKVLYENMSNIEFELPRSGK